MDIPNCFYRISAKALILDETKTKFLLLREENNKRDFPWWWLDFWEDPKKWIIRELLEETWLKIESISNQPMYFVTANRPKEDIWIANVFYETRIKDLNFIPSNECQEIKFISKKDAENLDIHPNVKAFIEQFNPKNHR